MKVKTSELTEAALDWAVAKCMGYVDSGDVVVDFEYLSGDDPVRWEPQREMYYSSAYSPSTDWADGGPIIERERIRLDPRGVWVAGHDSSNDEYTGPTPLIAAMRCFVASKLGDEVDVPDELTGEVSL